jgi:hypothetical protein
MFDGGAMTDNYGYQFWLTKLNNFNVGIMNEGTNAPFST